MHLFWVKFNHNLLEKILVEIFLSSVWSKFILDYLYKIIILIKGKAKFDNSLLDTSGFATKHVVGVCKTSYHLLISQPPTNLPNSLLAPFQLPYYHFYHYWLKTHTTEKESKMWTRYFPANGSTNPDVF